jgi:DNA-binding MarR family transcriptional regulator
MTSLSATELPCACATLRKASRSISRVYDAALAKGGLTSAQLPILRAISRQPWLPLSQLAAVMVMERTSLYRTLVPMIDSGWIAVKGSRVGEGRAKRVSLTCKGQTVTAAANVHWEVVQTRIVKTFGTKRWESLQQDIAELAALGLTLVS